MDNVNDDVISQIHAKGIEIPTQPAVLEQIAKEQAKQEPDFVTIAKLIISDVNLAASVLKTINSASFSVPNKISSIPQAMSLLGLQNLVTLINCVSLRQLMTRKAHPLLNQILSTAPEVARTSAWLARRIGDGAEDEPYALGLLRDCAMPLEL